MTTENALAGDGETVSAPVADASQTAPAAEQAQTDAQTAEGQTQEKAEGDKDNTGKSDAAEKTDKTPGKPKRPAFQERIDKVTREKHDAIRRAEAAEKELKRLGRQLPIRDDMTDAERQSALARNAYRDERREEAEEHVKKAAEDVEGLNREAARIRYETFAEKVADPAIVNAFCSLPKVSEPLADLVADSDHAKALAHHLLGNPHEVSRLNDMPPHMLGKAVASLEKRFSAPEAVRRVSQAPAPAATRLAGGSNPPGFQAEKASAGDIQEMLRKKGLIS